jgi:hypothetical protein
MLFVKDEFLRVIPSFKDAPTRDVFRDWSAVAGYPRPPVSTDLTGKVVTDPIQLTGNMEIEGSGAVQMSVQVNEVAKPPRSMDGLASLLTQEGQKMSKGLASAISKAEGWSTSSGS